MTVTYLPATSEVHDEAARINFEYLESNTVIGTYPARMFRSAAWTLGTTPGRIFLDTVSFDPTGRADIVTRGDYVCAADGHYLVAVAIGVTAVANSGIVPEIGHNGVSYSQGPEYVPSIVSGAGVAYTDIVHDCKTGDTIELWGFAGSAMTGQTAGTTFMNVVRIG